MIKTRFRELTDKKGVSINRVSTETGISRPTLTTMYKGNPDPTGIQFETLQTLIDYFGVDISDFLYVESQGYRLSLRFQRPSDTPYVEAEQPIPFGDASPIKTADFVNNRDLNVFSKRSDNVVDAPDDGVIYVGKYESPDNEDLLFSMAAIPIIPKQLPLFMGSQILIWVNGKSEKKERTLRIFDLLHSLSNEQLLLLSSMVLTQSVNRALASDEDTVKRLAPVLTASYNALTFDGKKIEDKTPMLVPVKITPKFQDGKMIFNKSHFEISDESQLTNSPNKIIAKNLEIEVY